MSRKKIILIIAIAFAVGVVAATGGFLIFRKYQISVNDRDKTDCMGTVVIDGFSIPIPNKYIASVDREVGLIYLDKSTFEMAISVEEGSYELTLQDLDSFNTDMGEWFQLMKPFDELAVDKSSYIYCVYYDEGAPILLAYKKADDEHIFQIMVHCIGIEHMKYQTDVELIREYESYILIADSLLAHAEPTDEEDTPSGVTYVSDEVYSDFKPVISEKFEPEGALYDEAETKLVEYKIEDNFYMIAQEIKSGIYSMKMYCDEDRDIVVTVVANTSFAGDMDARQLMTEGGSIWAGPEHEVKSMEIDGRVFYYYSYTEEYVSMDKPHKKYYFEAATDMKDGTIYCLSANSETNPEVLNTDTYLKFMTIEEP